MDKKLFSCLFFKWQFLYLAGAIPWTQALPALQWECLLCILSSKKS